MQKRYETTVFMDGEQLRNIPLEWSSRVTVSIIEYYMLNIISYILTFSDASCSFRVILVITGWHH